MKKKYLFMIVCFLCFTLMFACTMQNKEKESKELKDVNSIMESQSISNLYLNYNSNETLVKSSDTIIVGTVIKINEPEEIVIGKVRKNPNVASITNNEKYKEEKDISTIYTVSEVMIDKVLKGNCKVGDIIKIKQLGGSANIQYAQDVEYYKLNSRQVFFIQTYPEKNIPASVLNPMQGQIELIDNKINKHENNKLFDNAKNEDDIINIISSIVKDNSK